MYLWGLTVGVFGMLVMSSLSPETPWWLRTFLALFIGFSGGAIATAFRLLARNAMRKRKDEGA
jgi:ABC-type uncharacterized transport system permease subunit